MYYSDGDFTYSSGDGRNSSPSNGLSSGDIVGIAIGGFIALVLVIGLILWSGRKSPQPAPSSKNKKKTQNGDGIQSNPPPANGGNVEPAVSGAIQGNDPQPPSQGSLHHMAGGLQENHPPTIVGRGEPAVAGVIHGNASQSLPQRSLPHGLRENPPTSNAGHGQPEVAGAIQGNAPQPPSQGSSSHSWWTAREPFNY